MPLAASLPSVVQPTELLYQPFWSATRSSVVVTLVGAVLSILKSGLSIAVATLPARSVTVPEETCTAEPSPVVFLVKAWSAVAKPEPLAPLGSEAVKPYPTSVVYQPLRPSVPLFTLSREITGAVLSIWIGLLPEEPVLPTASFCEAAKACTPSVDSAGISVSVQLPE